MGMYDLPACFDYHVKFYGMDHKNKENYGKLVFNYNKYNKEIYKIKFSNNDEYLAIGYASGLVVIINFNPFDKINFAKEIFKIDDHKSVVTSLCFSMLNNLFIIGSWDDKMINMHQIYKNNNKLCNKQCDELTLIKSPITSACFALNECFLVIGRVDRNVIVYI